MYLVQLNNTPTPYMFIPYNQQYNNDGTESLQNGNDTRSAHVGMHPEIKQGSGGYLMAIETFSNT